MVAARANADVIVSWDWNDGTTQGWQGNSTAQATNVAGRLLVFNNGNGSLQTFSPFLTGTAASDWSHLDEVRFDVEILSYSGITSPSEFTAAALVIYGAGPALLALMWDLDVTGWQFGQIRTFVVPVSQPSRPFGDLTKEQILANVANAGLLFSKDFVMNTSSAYLDNFTVTSAPEPSSLLMLLTASLAIGIGCRWARFVRIRNSGERSVKSKACCAGAGGSTLEISCPSRALAWRITPYPFPSASRLFAK
jgi:hypothetical protein